MIVCAAFGGILAQCSDNPGMLMLGPVFRHLGLIQARGYWYDIKEPYGEDVGSVLCWPPAKGSLFGL